MDLKKCLGLAKAVGEILACLSMLAFLLLSIVVGGWLINLLGLYFILAMMVGWPIGLFLSRFNRNPHFLCFGYLIIGVASLFLPHLTFLVANWESGFGGLGLILKVVLVPLALIAGLSGYAVALDSLARDGFLAKATTT